ncbi:class 3-domain-containing protein [Globomyces pollinis-pini]|nr:class 3-domain-containing protein [Globomyces pollinis-pini]
MEGIEIYHVNYSQVHAGFTITYLSIRKKLQSTLQNTISKFPNYNLVFTGHYLGGVLATLAAIDFFVHNSNNTTKLSVYSYAQPRFANYEFAKFVQSLGFSKSYYRLHRISDPVVLLPKLFQGYVHVGKQYTLRDDSSVTPCHTTGPVDESKTCIDRDSWKPIINRHFDYYNYSGIYCGGFW